MSPSLFHEEFVGPSNEGSTMHPTPSSSSVSVAMATYNGASFIEEQLGSLAAQTHPPAELLSLIHI